MRLRGLVFERLLVFERAEVNFCDASGVPFDTIVLVGESGAGKTSLLRAIAGILSEAAGGAPELGLADVRSGAADARCRIVLDDTVDDARKIVTIEKELAKGGGALRGGPTFERWCAALAAAEQPRAAFAVERSAGNDVEADSDPLVEWLAAAPRVRVQPVLDRVLWPYTFSHVDDDAVAYFETPSGMTAPSTALGKGFESVLVMALELLRLTQGRELVYVIDDLDAHLHPRWQARILGDFRRAFPGVQLIVSTHSPWVVASVDPAQVFRIMDGTLTRVSERLQKGSAVAPVMDAAFGAPELPGPRWTNAPPRSLREEVIAALEPDLDRGSVLYVLPEPLHSRDAVDAFGEPAIPNANPGTGWLFFIDREPGVPWGHPCEYVFRGGDGYTARRRAIWPPRNLDRYVPIARG